MQNREYNKRAYLNFLSNKNENACIKFYEILLFEPQARWVATPIRIS